MKKTKLLVLGISSLLVLAGCTNNNSSSPVENSSSEISSITSSDTDKETSSSSNSEKSTSSETQSSSSSSSEEVKEYEIFVTTDNGATISGMPNKAEVGTEVHFTLAIKTGFKLGEIFAKSGTNSIELTAGFDGDYSFIMPKRGVSITVSTTRESYELNVYDAQGFIASVKQKKAGATEYTDLETVTTTDTDDDGEEITSTYKAAEYGATVLATLNSSVKGYKLTGITVNGKAVDLADDATEFTFVMDHEATSITVSYSLTPVAVTIVNSDHFTLSLFASDKTTAVTDSYTPYEDLYIQASSSSDDYAIKAIVYSYTDSNSKINKVDITDYYEDGYYHFTMPKVDTGITITVTEYNLHAYNDYDFVGTYSHVDFSYSAAKDITAFDSAAKMTIAESGDITYVRSASRTYDDYSIGTVNGTTNEGTMSLTKAGNYDTATIAYKGNVIVYDSYFKGSASSSSDIAVGYKQSSDAVTYTAKATQFKIGSVTYALATFFEDGVEKENVLIERGSTNTIHYDVDVELLEGSYVSDATAVFKVKEGDETLLKVGYTGVGGAANRVTLGDEYGTYTTSDGKSLRLDGVSQAIYDDNSYSYTISGTTITLSSNSKIIVGTIDSSTMTFTVTSEEEVTTFAWYGKTYRGKAQWSYNDDEEESTYTVTFHSNESKFDQKCALGNYSISDVDYTVSDGTIITTKFYDYSNKNGFSITMTYNASSDSFTVKGGVTGAYFNNATFTLVS